MCITIRVEYSCGCYGRTLGKQTCRRIRDSDIIAAESITEGFKGPNILFELYRGYCKGEEEEKGVKGVLVERMCSKCVIKGADEAEETRKSGSQVKGKPLRARSKDGSRKRLSVVAENYSE